MSDKVRQKQQRDARLEADRIRLLLRRHGGRDYDASREDEHDEGGFEIQVAKDRGPHYVDGFHYDPFRMWPPLMRQHAKTLTEHGYQVKVVSHYDDGEILEVRAPAKPPRGGWLRALFRG